MQNISNLILVENKNVRNDAKFNIRWKKTNMQPKYRSQRYRQKDLDLKGLVFKLIKRITEYSER